MVFLDLAIRRLASGVADKPFLWDYILSNRRCRKPGGGVWYQIKDFLISNLMEAGD